MDDETKSKELIPDIDRNYLNAKGFSYIIIPEAGSVLLIIKDYPLSKVYSPQAADLLIILPAGYPSAPLDMFWTFPDVKLENGTWPIAADHHQQLNGKNWQRWSRHGNWRPGIDSLKNFLMSVRKEINKGI